MKLAFALEYSLGHKTHAQNLKAALAGMGGIDPHYVDIPFADTPVPTRWMMLKPVRENWSIRASLAARHGLSGCRNPSAAFFHSQVTALFSVGFMQRVPSIVSLDATPLQYDQLGASYGHQVGSGRIEALKKRLNQRAFRAAACLVTWSEWAKGSLVEDYGVPAGKIHVIPPGIDISQWRIDRGRRKEGPVRALFVGGDFERKGGPQLLTALCLARGRGAEIDLDVVTKSDRDWSHLDGVRIHTDVSPNSPEMHRLFADADLFVLPTLGDCLPLVILEALASGLPVVTTDVGAISEAVSDGVEGRVVEAGAVEPLADALADVAMDAAARAAMSEHAFAKACERFSADKNYHRLVDLMVDFGQRGRH